MEEHTDSRKTNRHEFGWRSINGKRDWDWLIQVGLIVVVFIFILFAICSK